MVPSVIVPQVHSCGLDNLIPSRLWLTNFLSNFSDSHKIRKTRQNRASSCQNGRAGDSLYGTVYRTTLSATCTSESLQRLEEEWHNRNRQHFWGITTLLVLTPMIMTTIFAGFVQLDWHNLGNRRRLLVSLDVLILIIGGVTVQRLWQCLQPVEARNRGRQSAARGRFHERHVPECANPPPFLRPSKSP